MATFEIQHLSRKFLSDINLSAGAGELVAIAGAAGSGKTLLLRAVAGLEPIDSGDVLVNGRSVIGIAPRDRGIALVHAHQVLYPHLTVYGNIAFGLKLAKVPRPELDRRVRESARVLGLSGLLDRDPHGLTPDKRPLVSIGRALARNPRVLLLDEPLGNLQASREDLLREIVAIHERLGTVTLFATRNLADAKKLPGRIMTMDAGRLV